MHRLRIPCPEPGRRRAAQAQHAPQHPPVQDRGRCRSCRRALRYHQPSLSTKCGHQTWDGIQRLCYQMSIGVLDHALVASGDLQQDVVDIVMINFANHKCGPASMIHTY